MDLVRAIVGSDPPRGPGPGTKVIVLWASSGYKGGKCIPGEIGVIRGEYDEDWWDIHLSGGRAVWLKKALEGYHWRRA